MTNPDLWMNLLRAVMTAGAVSFLISGWVAKNGLKLKIVDDPKTHRHEKNTHIRPVPRGGGLPILGAMIAGMWLMPHNTRTAGILAGVTILAIVGFLDDRFQEKVSPYIRLVVNVLAALCVIGVGIGIAYITNPTGGVIRLDLPQWCFSVGDTNHCVWILSDLFALIWLVWMQNIVGWSSGVDGQLPGFVVVAAIAMGLLGMRAPTDVSQVTIVTLSGIIAGAYAGFWPWNWYPQRIMPGYGGKSLAGFLLGILAIYSGAKVGTMILVLSVPFIDAVMVIIKRIREGRSPVWGGREHLHHFLLDKGWSRRQIAGFYLGVSVIFSGLALQLKAELKYFTMATVILVLAGTILWLQHWSTSLKQPDQDSGSRT